MNKYWFYIPNPPAKIIQSLDTIIQSLTEWTENINKNNFLLNYKRHFAGISEGNISRC